MENNFDFNLGLNFNNFDPTEIQSDETINAVLVVDVSPSVGSYANELNTAFREFVQEMQQSHVSEKLLVSVIEFNEKVNPRTGFQPIKSLDTNTFTFTPHGRSTALYDATLSGIKNAIDYRTNLENSGVDCKTLVFVITDGEDMCSQNKPSVVKSALNDILKDEKNMFSFETILFGVGDDANFTRAKEEMGIKHLAKIGNSGKEIRKMIGFISASISKSSSGDNISF